MASEKTVQTQHPDGSKELPRISEAKYQAVKRAILQAVPTTTAGIRFGDLPTRVADLLPASARETLGAVSWYETVVKLDLEARGEIERVPSSRPQRIRRVQ